MVSAILGPADTTPRTCAWSRASARGTPVAVCWRMRFRSIATRAVLVAAALASVATSPPRDHVLYESSPIDLVGPVTVRAYVRANLPAFEHADELRLDISITSEQGQTLTLIPDDPFQPIVEVVLTNRYWEHRVTWLGGDPCPRDDGAGCELGVSIEAPRGTVVTVDVSGQAIRYGDPSFFFPENRQFPQDAAIEVGFDE